MVELKGSEKQVKWASDLRDMVLEYANKCLNSDTKKRERIIAKGKPSPKTDAKIEKEKIFIERVENEESASAIIEEFNFMTDKYADVMFKRSTLNSIIFDILG